MTRTPGLVSVVLPVRNAEAYIIETLEAALRQTYRQLEIIVVDDGSTDDSGALVAKLCRQDARVRLLTQANAGVAAARNLAISRAHGEFIAPLDADDVWDRTKIERQVRRMREFGDHAGLCYSRWAWIDIEGHVLDVAPPWNIEGSAADTLIEVNFTGNASVPLFRAACLDVVGGYDVTLRERGGEGCEDWDLAVRIAERYHVCAVPEVLVGYRRRADGMSTAHRSMQRSHALMVDAIGSRDPARRARVSRRSRDQLALHLAGVSMWSGKYLLAVWLGLQALRSGIGFRVLPYLPQVLVRRVRGDRHGRSVSTVGGDFADAEFPPPLLPYHRIYHRRRQRRPSDVSR